MMKLRYKRDKTNITHEHNEMNQNVHELKHETKNVFSLLVFYHLKSWFA